jgi:hypothetical protein
VQLETRAHSGFVEVFDRPPEVIERVRPVYPEMARQAGIEGVVVLKVDIDEVGRFREALVLQSVPHLTAADARFAGSRSGAPKRSLRCSTPLPGRPLPRRIPGRRRRQWSSDSLCGRKAIRSFSGYRHTPARDHLACPPGVTYHPARRVLGETDGTTETKDTDMNPLSHVQGSAPSRLRTVPVILLLASLLLASPAACEEIPEIPAAAAADYVGRTATVCGRVMSAAHFGSVRGGPTFLNLDKPYPDQVFTVVIWNQNRGRFERPPERMFDGRSICVTGTIETYRGKPQIEVVDPGQIRLAGPSHVEGELQDSEALLVKVLLASLGYDVSYGSAVWDQETVAAILSFQEEAGLEPTGDPDPATLRALAGTVPDLSVDDRTLAIRLVLLEAVRRWE